MRIPLIGRRKAAAAGALQFNATPRKKSGLSWLFMLTLVTVATLMGMVTGVGSPILLTVMGGAVFATMLFFVLNAQGLLLALFVVTFLVQGSLLYYFGLRQATWVAVGMAAMFFFRVLMDLTAHSSPIRRERAAPASGVALAVLAYAACFGFSLLLNHAHLAQLVASIKSVWPMFSVLAAFYWIQWSGEKIQRLWQLLILIGVMQLPVVFHQHFFGAGAHYGTFDSIVGTFGGTPLGGGLSSILVLFTIMIMAYSLALWNRGLMSRRLAFSICFIGLDIILLGEVKAAFIWLPLVLFMVLRRRIMKNLFTLIGYGTLAVAMLGTIYIAYNAFYWGHGMDRLHSVSEKLNGSGGYFFDVNNINYTTGEISRGASIALWAQDRFSSPGKRLIGYGPGASKSSSSLGIGELTLRFRPLHIDATAIAELLWDTGVLGTLAYCAIPIAAWRAGRRFLRAGQGTQAQLASVETCTAMMVLFLSLLCYNRMVLDEPTAELMFMFCLGCIVQAVRYGPEGVVAATPAAATPAAADGRAIAGGLPGRRPAQYA